MLPCAWSSRSLALTSHGAQRLQAQTEAWTGEATWPVVTELSRRPGAGDPHKAHHHTTACQLWSAKTPGQHPEDPKGVAPHPALALLLPRVTRPIQGINAKAAHLMRLTCQRDAVLLDGLMVMTLRLHGP